MEQNNQELPPKGGGDSDKSSKAESPPKTSGDGGVVYKYKRGAWSKEEDEKLRKAVEEHGDHNWITIERSSGLARPAKNCRLRWTNYLRPNLKKCPFTPEEESKILLLHSKYGNSWSRIASKLPGRSDNEIKNFWHKRAKKCLPIYPPKKQEDQQTLRNVTTTHTDHFADEKNTIDEFWPKEHQIPTNYPKFTLPSSSINSEFQSSQNTVFFQPDSLESPHNPISAQQPQFLPSPRSLPCYQQSPTNHFSQTIPSPRTPTSQPHQNLLLSPHQLTRSCPSTPIMGTQIQAPSPQQGVSTLNAFTPDKKPPILMPPQGRFKRFSRETSQVSLSGSGSGSSIENATVLLNPDSSQQKQWSSAIESPRTPLKLNFSPGVPELYSVHNTPDSSSVFQMKSPPTAPLSPPNQHLSSLSSPQSKPSCGGLDLSPVHQTSFSFDHDITMDSSFTFRTEPHPVQYYPQTSAGVSSSLHEGETDSNMEILDALKEAQAKVRFLKKKLKQSEIMKKKENPGSPETAGLTGNGLRTKYLIEESLKVNAPRKNSRTKDVIKIISSKKDDVSGKISKTGVLLVKSPSNGKTRRKPQKQENSDSGNCTEDDSTDTEELSRNENSGEKSLLVDNLQGEHSINESNSRKRKEPLTNQNIMNGPSFSDSWAGIQFPLQVPAGKNLSECSSIEGLQSESSSFVQDSFLIGDLLGKTSGMEGQLASDGHELLIDAFGPSFSQSIATTLENSGNGGSQLRYLDEGGYLGNSIGRGFSDGMERRFTEGQKFIEGNLGETSKLSLTSLLLNQYPTANRLEPNYKANQQIMDYGHMGDAQYSFDTSGNGNFAGISNLCESSLSMNQYRTTNLQDSSYQVTSSMYKECPEGNSKEQPSWEQNLWQEGTMVTPEQKQLNKFGSVVDPSEMAQLIGSNNWNRESSNGSTGKIPGQGQEHELINTMPEELSSLLEFFATSNQTPEWYYNGNTIPATEASDDSNMDINLHMSEPVNFADFF